MCASELVRGKLMEGRSKEIRRGWSERESVVAECLAESLSRVGTPRGVGELFLSLYLYNDALYL